MDKHDLMVHGRLMTLRNQVYARTDDKEFQRVWNLGDLIEGAPNASIPSTSG